MRSLSSTRTVALKERTLIPISASAGITLSASPERNRPTVTTADSLGSTLRETTVCNAITMAADATSGSTREMRPRRVAAYTDDLDEGPVTRCQERAGAHQEVPLRRARMVVHGEHHVAGKTLEQAVGHHGLSAAVEAAFFRRLEDQVEGAREPARGRQMLGRAQQHRGVAVVAAGVHAAGDRAGIRQAGVLLDGQGVHVGAQAQAFRAIAQTQLRHQACLADATCDLIAPLLQLVGDQVGGLVFGEGQLGMPMDMAAPAGQLVMQRLQVVDPGELLMCHQLESSTILLSRAMRW